MERRSQRHTALVLLARLTPTALAQPQAPAGDETAGRPGGPWRRLFLAFPAILVAAAAAAPVREVVVDPMTSAARWQLGGRRVNYTLGESSVSPSREQARPGAEASLRLTYDFREPQRDYLSAYWTGQPIPGRCESVSFWLFGDRSGRTLSLAVEDAAGSWFDRQVGAVDWAGWRQVTVPVGDAQDWRALGRRGDDAPPLAHPALLRQLMTGMTLVGSLDPGSQRQPGPAPAPVRPLWLRQIAVARGPAAAPLQGAVYLSDLRARVAVAPLDAVECTLDTGQASNLLSLNGDHTLRLHLANRGAATAQGTATLSLCGFFGPPGALATRSFRLGPGQEEVVEARHAPTHLGAVALEATLAGDGVSRVFRRSLAIVDPSDRPDPTDPSDHGLAGSPGTFGGHTAIGSYRADQLPTVARLNRDAGARWERLTFDWQVLEPAPGSFVWDPPRTVEGARGRAIAGPAGLATPPDPCLDLQEAVTLAFWLRADKHPGDWQWPVLKYADEPHRNYGVFLHKDTGVASFTAAFERGDRGPYWGCPFDGSPWNDGQWHHLAATYAAGAGILVLYVDGREVKREALNAGRLRSGSAAGLRLASSYHGDLDEVVVCSRALAAEEIAALAAWQDPPAAGLVAWWSFDDADAPGLDRGPHRLQAVAGTNAWMITAAERARAQGQRILGILGFPPAWASTAPAGAARPWVHKPRLDAWERYVEATTRHFAGTVDCWEIWNEPNIAVFWEPKPDAREFMDLVRTGYAAAKRGNPQCTVVTPGLAGAGEHGGDFLEEMIRAGVVRHGDGLSIHPYRQTTPEESDLVGDLTRIAALCEEHGGRRPLWITEWCWTTEVPWGSTERRSALMTGRGIPLALGTGLVDRIFWFRLADPGTDRFYSEDNYGLCYHDLTPKPSYFAFRTCARLLDGARPTADVTTQAGLWARQFQRDGQTILALWTPQGRAAAAIPTGQGSVPVVDLMGNEYAVPTRDGMLFVDASEAVLFVRLNQPVSAVSSPVEFIAPKRIGIGEPTELRLAFRNPLAQAVEVAVQLGEPLGRDTLTARVPAHGTADLPIPFTPAAGFAPGRHPIVLGVQWADLAWFQDAWVMVTSIPAGDALVGHWSFDEGQGAVAHDTTPHALHGTITGCQWVPGRKGTALAFGGSSAQAVGGVAAPAAVPDLVTIPDAPALNLPEEVTVAFWLRLDGDTGSWQFPVAKFRGNQVRNYGVYIRPGDVAAAFSTSLAGEAAPHLDVAGGPGLNDGQWHHLAATCALAESRISVYVDGRRVGSQGISPAPMKAVAEPLRIGAGTRGGIDEVRVYGRALSADEISRLATDP